MLFKTEKVFSKRHRFPLVKDLVPVEGLNSLIRSRNNIIIPCHRDAAAVFGELANTICPWRDDVAVIWVSILCIDSSGYQHTLVENRPIMSMINIIILHRHRSINISESVPKGCLMSSGMLFIAIKALTYNYECRSLCTPPAQTRLMSFTN